MTDANDKRWVRWLAAVVRKEVPERQPEINVPEPKRKGEVQFSVYENEYGQIWEAVGDNIDSSRSKLISRKRVPWTEGEGLDTEVSKRYGE